MASNGRWVEVGVLFADDLPPGLKAGGTLSLGIFGELRIIARQPFKDDKRPGDKGVPKDWPWDPKWWKPSENRIRDLVKAGALICAEIDRIWRDDARDT